MRKLSIAVAGASCGTVAFSGKPIFVGSSVNNDLIINHASVSDMHAVFWLEDGVIWVKDLASDFGSWVNGERTSRRTQVDSKSRVRLGNEVSAVIEHAKGRSKRNRDDRRPNDSLLTVTLSGPSGPRAAISGGEYNQSLTIDAANPAVMLFVLGQRALEDRQKDMEPSDVGWCSDQDIERALWGARPPGGNSLHAALYRLRRRLSAAGFDPRCIEKRRRSLRLVLPNIEIV